MSTPHSVNVNGITTSLSEESGSLISYGRKEDLGKSVNLIKNGSGPSLWLHANYVEYKDKVVAIFTDVPPADYSLGMKNVTITANYVAQMDNR